MIEVIRQGQNSLSRKVYRFTVFSSCEHVTISLRGIRLETRASNRHRKWKTIQEWPYTRRIGFCARLGDVSVPDDVIADVRQIVASNTTVVLPSEK